MVTFNSKLVAGRRALRRRRSMAGDPRSYFYGDAVPVDPQTAADAITSSSDAAADVIASTAPTEADAEQRVTAYSTLSPDEKAQITLLPPLAVWNAQVIQNPVVGRLSAANLNYNLTKNLNEMPFQGRTFAAAAQQDATGKPYYADVKVEAAAEEPSTYGIPIMTFSISNSTLNAPTGGIITMAFSGEDVNGNSVDTISAQSQYQYSFQRLSATEPVRGVFIPFQVVATRTLPFMPIYKYAAENAKVIHFRFSGLAKEDTVYVNVLGYASQELKEIASVYNLPAGAQI